DHHPPFEPSQEREGDHSHDADEGDGGVELGHGEGTAQSLDHATQPDETDQLLGDDRPPDGASGSDADAGDGERGGTGKEDATDHQGSGGVERAGHVELFGADTAYSGGSVDDQDRQGVDDDHGDNGGRTQTE